MKPKVLFMDHVGVLGGGELSLLDIARYYGDAGKVLLLEDGPFRERLEQAGVPVEVLPAPRSVSDVRREGGGMRDLQAVPGVFELGLRVARLARDYDVIYANSQKSLIVGALAGKMVRKPVIWHLRDMLTADHFSRTHRRLAVTLANLLTARVVANSKATAQAFVQNGGKTGRVRVVYNGIDPSPYESVTPAEVDLLREELGLDGAPVVGVFSRLAPWKGQHVLLESLARLPEVHALLVGGALFGERHYADSLREQARALGVADRVRFLGFRADVPQLMQLSDVVVHTSVAPEPFGRTVVEGMLSRRPVVASWAGGISEIVEDGVSGVLVPPGDPEALAGSLFDLFEDSAWRRSLAVAGYTAASERFSLRAMLEGVERQVQEVVALRRPRASRTTQVREEIS